jgi:hypothetical protein
MVEPRDLWLCSDCTQIACNGPSGIDVSPRYSDILVQTIINLRTYLVPNFDSESGYGIEKFSRLPCDLCRTPLAGSRSRFTIRLRQKVEEQLGGTIWQS